MTLTIKSSLSLDGKDIGYFNKIMNDRNEYLQFTQKENNLLLVEIFINIVVKIFKLLNIVKFFKALPIVTIKNNKFLNQKRFYSTTDAETIINNEDLDNQGVVFKVSDDIVYVKGLILDLVLYFIIVLFVFKMYSVLEFGVSFFDTSLVVVEYWIHGYNGVWAVMSLVVVKYVLKEEVEALREEIEEWKKWKELKKAVREEEEVRKEVEKLEKRKELEKEVEAEIKIEWKKRKELKKGVREEVEVLRREELKEALREEVEAEINIELKKAEELQEIEREKEEKAMKRWKELQKEEVLIEEEVELLRGEEEWKKWKELKEELRKKKEKAWKRWKELQEVGIEREKE